MLDLTVIIVTWKVRDLLLDCLRTVPGAMGGLSGETIVVDNASGDGTVEAVKQQFPDARGIANAENTTASTKPNR